MKIEHLAIWVADLEKMKNFYVEFMGGESGALYHNPTKKFTSYFISFEDGCRLELMHRPDINSEKSLDTDSLGLVHFAISVGNKENVVNLTEQLRHAGYNVLGEPRTTGDGYFESVIADPEGNKIEITT